VLARLDTAPLRDRLASADARLAAASANVARDAAGTRPQQIREAEAAVADAEAALGESRRLHERRRALLAKGFISRADYSRAKPASQRHRRGWTLRAPPCRWRARASASRTGQRHRPIAPPCLPSVRRLRPTSRIPGCAPPSRAGAHTCSRSRGDRPAGRNRAHAGSDPASACARLCGRAGFAESPARHGRARARRRSDRDWPARIGFISPVAEFTPKTVQTEQLRADLVYRLRLTVEDPKGELRQGQPVTVIVPVGQDEG